MSRSGCKWMFEHTMWACVCMIDCQVLWNEVMLGEKRVKNWQQLWVGNSNTVLQFLLQLKRGTKLGVAEYRLFLFIASLVQQAYWNSRNRAEPCKWEAVPWVSSFWNETVRERWHCNLGQGWHVEISNVQNKSKPSFSPFQRELPTYQAKKKMSVSNLRLVVWNHGAQLQNFVSCMM